MSWESELAAGGAKEPALLVVGRWTDWDGTFETRHCPLRCVTAPGDRGRVRFDLANRYIGYVPGSSCLHLEGGLTPSTCPLYLGGWVLVLLESTFPSRRVSHMEKREGRGLGEPEPAVSPFPGTILY